MPTTKETSMLQPDVETIMRRLKGDALAPTYRTPVTPSELDQLKTLVKTLGNRLKEAYADLSEKNETISRLQRDAHNSESEQSCALKEELEAYRQKESAWSAEKKLFEAALENEKRRSVTENSSNNSQLVRLSLTSRQLEEEIHALKCERAATLRQLTQQKELLERQEKELVSEKEGHKELAETIATQQKTIEKLLATLEHQKVTIKTLTESNETIEKQVSLLTLEKSRADALSKELFAAQDQMKTLVSQLDGAKTTIAAAQEKTLEAHREKELSDIRVKEVEELLITKLETIAELEEELGTASSYAEDVQLQLNTAEQESDRLAKEVQQSNELNKALTEKLSKLEQQLTKTNAELVDARKRHEFFERLKKSSAEAAAHALSIVKLLETAPKTQPIDELKGFEPSLFEERRTHHDLL